ncbi:toxin [Trichloromonas sp.]|uniref:toxin n=1 Tax=Trichloromonas sp. TaxID=3069249 RepID=UPI003D813F66
MSKYLYHPTDHFAGKLEKVRRHDRSGHARILQVIERLLQTPGDADGWMHGVHHGRLKKYVGRRDYRLIYHWCEQCRKETKKLEEHCGSCGEVTDHSVVFFDIYHKNEQTAHLRHLG